MNWFLFSTKEWRRRPLRTAITAAGVAIAVAAVFSLLMFQDGYRQGLSREIDRLGAHILVVPKGCPYDAASIALHGANWPCYLNSAYLAEISRSVGVLSAAPALMAAFNNAQGAATVYVGIDDRMLALKPGWRIDGSFPHGSGEILAGAEVARRHAWKVGGRVALPEIPGRRATVAGILQPTQGADDTFIYTRLEDAQQWFQHRGELTHILVRLRDANLLEPTVLALRGCTAGMDMNIVPLAHLFHTIQGLMNSTRVLLGCIALIGLLIAGTGVSNAVLMSVTERGREIGILRALGASRVQVFGLIWLETIQVCVAGGVAGVLLAFFSSHAIESWLRTRLPFAPTDSFLCWSWSWAVISVAGAAILGVVAALLPAARAAELAPLEAIREGATP
ncbi:MAG TPA: ABC transporter permease [Verrucomicrobiae bacterium]|nr:ABC transporter permease [Verrucomicrobiae bacterium]